MTDWVEEEESHATHSIGAHDFTPIRHNILFGFKHQFTDHSTKKRGDENILPRGDFCESFNPIFPEERRHGGRVEEGFELVESCMTRRRVINTTKVWVHNVVQKMFVTIPSWA
ncbi:Uncharacterised protein [Vibrio cholerae]|nr:Uncharacterised protein [Vibrio cholerae]CSB15332.1 Uncharacterised protein [Vibrio cholerae]CSB62732.1 Uncharacterised protein [Vibrio cholerae]